MLKRKEEVFAIKWWVLLKDLGYDAELKSVLESVENLPFSWRRKIRKKKLVGGYIVA